MFKNFVIAYDHRVDIKFIERVTSYLKENNLEYKVVEDDGEANDYPVLADMAHNLYLTEGADGMILLCGTGVGMNMVANKFDGIRAVLSSDEATAYYSRRDEDANTIVFAAGKADENYEVKLCKRKMIRMLDVFVKTEFMGEERFVRRIAQMSKIEKAGKL